MAEPKKRTNKYKGGMRRMRIRAKAPSIVYCDNCHEAVVNHQVCKNCGYYKGKKFINIDSEKEVIEKK